MPAPTRMRGSQESCLELQTPKLAWPVSWVLGRQSPWGRGDTGPVRRGRCHTLLTMVPGGAPGSIWPLLLICKVLILMEKASFYIFIQLMLKHSLATPRHVCQLDWAPWLAAHQLEGRCLEEEGSQGGVFILRMERLLLRERK